MTTPPSLTHPLPAAADLPLEARVAQLIFPHLEGATPPDGPAADGIVAELGEVGYGGYIVFRGDTGETPRLLDRLQAAAALPLLIASDIEAGVGLQVKGATRFPCALALAAGRDPARAYAVGKATAGEARALGISWAFAPLADVNTNPANPIINCRSYGDDPALVGDLAAAFVRGCQEHGLLATAKHFPGHGDTDRDSHRELPVVVADRDALERIHLEPFRRCIAADVAAIMTAHVRVPALEPETPELPATISPAVMRELLRGQLGFAGLVVTDALNMDGIKGADDGETALAALLAGCDVLLMPRDPRAIHRYLAAAARDGRLPADVLDRAAGRVLAAKARLGGEACRARPPLPEEDWASHAELARAVAEDSLTLVRDRRGRLPLPLGRPDGLRLLVVDDDGQEGVAEPWIAEAARRLPGTPVTTVRGPEDLPALAALLAGDPEAIACAVFTSVKAWKGRVGLSPPLLEALEGFARAGAPLAVVIFGSPYDADALPSVDALVCAYGPHRAAQHAAWRALAGEIPCRGRLPVTLALDNS